MVLEQYTRCPSMKHEKANQLGTFVQQNETHYQQPTKPKTQVIDGANGAIHADNRRAARAAQPAIARVSTNAKPSGAAHRN
jgi:hypothetical protein